MRSVKNTMRSEQGTHHCLDSNKQKAGTKDEMTSYTSVINPFFSRISLCCNLRHQRTRRAPFSNGLSKNRHRTSSREW